MTAAELAAKLREADAAIATRQEREYRGAREVELRDQAVKCLRDCVDHLTMQRWKQLEGALENVARPIVEEIDELHAIALNMRVDQARRVA